MLKRVLIAIVSILVFGILMGLLNFITSPYNDFDSFWLPAVFFASHSAPVYLIGGIPISYLIERFIGRLNFNSPLARHYTKYAIYIFLGIVVGVIYVAILKISGSETDQNVLMYIIGGVLASLIFYYVSLAFEKKATS